MASPSIRLPSLLIALAVLAAGPASGSEIWMQDGSIYSGVTILHRDSKTIDFSTRYGEVSIPLSMVAKIDGVRLTTPGATLPGALSNPVKVLTPPSAQGSYPAPVAPASPLAAASVRPMGTASPAASATPRSTPPVSGAAGNGAANLRSWFFVAILLGCAGYGLYRWSGPVLRRRKPAVARTEDQTVFEFLDTNYNPMVIKTGEEASGIANAQDVITDAMLDRASDVHIEPAAAEYRVRFRIDGLMHSRMKFAPAEGIRMVAAIKSLAQIDVAERRKAQDGRFGGRGRGRNVDFRVATTPSIFGEKLVLRILDHKSGLRGLEDLGMTQEMMERFQQTIRSRNGMIVAAGPTGSGKTSTLYAALMQLDAERLNLVTIEDPVEYQLDGATQIAVNARAGITYESGLRSVLRQDPDVILVGEMRDLEAAKIALRSALTGHLVFSSLHSRDAIGTIMRLEEIGIERHLLASSLFVVLAQRLVRVLCPICREAYPCAGEELAEVGLALTPGETIFRAVGCRKCSGTGYVGRTGVFEMLVFDEPLREAVNGGAAENVLAELAHKSGYRGYREDAAVKILLGITTVDEVLQAV